MRQLINRLLAAYRFKNFTSRIEHFAGARENHKYYLVMMMNYIRHFTLAMSVEYVKDKRLNHVPDVFSCRLSDIVRSENEPEWALQDLIETRQEELTLRQTQPYHPRLFDSRGRCYAPKVRVDDQGVQGFGVSAGYVRGRVRILREPDAGMIEPGDILVTRATDPGWTPLFATAGGVILEIGGALQHGALVAREYGLPCIVGVENIYEQFEDGQYITMDGLMGLIQKQSGSHS